MDPVGTRVLEPFARNHRRSEDLGAAQKSRAPRARPRPPSSHCGSSSDKLWTIVSSSEFAPLRRGNHRLSWRKGKRTRMITRIVSNELPFSSLCAQMKSHQCKLTRMEIASSTQRRRCFLREECEDALLLKEQCTVDEKSNKRFSGAPRCLRVLPACTLERSGIPANVQKGRLGVCSSSGDAVDGKCPGSSVDRVFDFFRAAGDGTRVGLSTFIFLD